MTIARDVAELVELRADWDHLASLDPTHSAYRGWTAQVHHHLMRADGSIPHVGVFRNGGGEVIGIVPTAIGTTRHGPIRLRILRPLAQQTWPDFAVLLDPQDRIELSAALHQWLARVAAQVDRVDLRFVRDERGCIAPTDGPLRLEVTPVPTFRVTFPDGTRQWSELLGRHARQAIRNQERRLLADHGATINTLADPVEIARWIVPFQSLHTHRAQLLGRDRLFEIGTTGRDFGLMLSAMVSADEAEFHVLTSGERLISGQITFRAGTTTHDYRRAFDDEFARYGPGSVLQAAVLQRSLERGDRQFDFGLGAGAHKSRWATESDPTYRIHHARGFRHATLACYARIAIARNRLRSGSRDAATATTAS